jgi:putative ABC transport system permease protein
MRFLLDLAWRDLRASGRSLWVFCACLMLGVALVAAGGGLHRQVASAIQADVRALFGGDIEVRSRQPLDAPTLAWMEQRGTVSRLVQLRTMLRGPDGRSQLIELQSVDDRYPLVGQLGLAPPEPLNELLALREGRWGIVLDPVLLRRLGLAPGSEVEVGELTLQVRAALEQQPDRNLRADWGAAPVLLAEGALQATELIQPFSRVQYRYRVRTAEPTDAWRGAFLAAFPDGEAEIRTADDRGDRITEVLGQIASGLLLVGVSALFIGGLGVFNSVQAYLQGKLGTLATLRALGLRDARLATMVLLQVLMLALGASLVGAVMGAALALGGLVLVAGSAPAGAAGAPALAAALPGLLPPMGVAVAFGVLTALSFALPALGRALTVSPAALFRGIDGGALRTPAAAWLATAACAAVGLVLLLVVLPDARFGLAFIAIVAALLLVLEGLLRGVRRLGAHALARPDWHPPFELRVALAGLQRPGSPLRASLLSLGSALTLLVACTLVLATLLRTVNDTVPTQAPGLVLYDVQTEQLPLVREVLAALPGTEAVQTAPLVLGRLVAVNGEDLRDSADPRRRAEARDEHKLSHREGNIDDVIVTRGAWWPAAAAGAPGPARVAMEDREADQLGLQVGDRLRFEILGQTLEAELDAIYAQRRFQSRLWLEAIFSDGALDPFVTRHVGAAWLSPEAAITAQDRLAEAAPNIVSVRTASVLEATRALMGRASAALAVIGGACLAASLLVLASVVAASRARQMHEASVMHALGARIGSLRRVLRWEYTLLALVTAGFATGVGSALALALLRWRMDLDASGLLWTGALTALVVSVLSLGAGAQVLMAQLRASPAVLLRSSA